MKIITPIRFRIITGLLLLIFLLPLTCRAEIKVRLDRDVIGIDETVRLFIEADGARNSISDIDTSALEKDFSILSRSSSSNFKIINGSTNFSKTWTLEIEPKRVGKLTIPPFSIGGEQSQALSLKVTDSTPDPALNQGKLRDIILEVTPEMDTPAYLQGQITITVKLFLNQRLRITDASLEEPKIEHAIVKKLGNDHNYKVNKGGISYQVIERKYAIIAEEGKQVTVPPLHFQATSLESGNRGFGGDPFFDRFVNRGRRLRVKSQKLTIALTPIPKEFNGKIWLPARKLAIIEDKSDKKELKVGEPLTRVIQVEALGLTAEQLPELKIETPPGGKLYLDQPELKTQVDKGEILHAVRRQSLAFIPSRPGTFTLPAIKIKWWDVVNNRQQVATLPEKKISVIAGKPAAPAATTATVPETANPETGKNSAAKPELNKGVPETVKTETESSQTTIIWQGISAVLLLLWLFTLFFWYRSLKRQESRNFKDKAISARANASRDQIKKACLNHDPRALQQAILDWAAATWPKEAPANLETVAKKLENPALKTIFKRIEEALYSPVSSSTFDGEQVWSELADQLKAKLSDKSANRPDKDRLPPLYR